MTWAWLGTIHAYRTRGKETLQPLEQPIKIALMGSAATHYLGLSSGWSAALGGLFLIAWEVGAFLAGRFDYKAGVLSEQQRQLNLQDPWKMALLESQQDLLAEVTRWRLEDKVRRLTQEPLESNGDEA